MVRHAPLSLLDLSVWKTQGTALRRWQHQHEITSERGLLSRRERLCDGCDASESHISRCPCGSYLQASSGDCAGLHRQMARPRGPRSAHGAPAARIAKDNTPEIWKKFDCQCTHLCRCAFMWTRSDQSNSGRSFVKLKAGRRPRRGVSHDGGIFSIDFKIDDGNATVHILPSREPGSVTLTLQIWILLPDREQIIRDTSAWAASPLRPFECKFPVGRSGLSANALAEALSKDRHCSKGVRRKVRVVTLGGLLKRADEHLLVLTGSRDVTLDLLQRRHEHILTQLYIFFRSACAASLPRCMRVLFLANGHHHSLPPALRNGREGRDAEPSILSFASVEHARAPLQSITIGLMESPCTNEQRLCNPQHGPSCDELLQQVPSRISLEVAALQQYRPPVGNATKP